MSDVMGSRLPPLSSGWHVVKFYPELLAAEIPAHLPKPVEDILREAEEAKRRKQRHGAGLLYGKVLDIAFKRFDSNIRGTLHSRIDQLGKSGQLTKELAQWALELKVIRNDSTHEEEPFEDKDITDIAAATQLMLQYLFTMPAKVKALTATPTAAQP